MGCWRAANAALAAPGFSGQLFVREETGVMKAMRREIEGSDVAAAPVVSEGGRSPSTLTTGLPGMTPNPSGRWRPGALERGAQAGGGVAPASRRVRGASVAGAWRADLQARTMAGEGGRRPGWRAEGARKRPRERRTGRRDAAHRRAQHGGRAAARQNRASRPFGPQEVAVMAEATSPTTGRRYGVARVCQIWDQPRSSFYAACAARQPQAGAVTPASPSARRGPKPSVGDEALLAA